MHFQLVRREEEEKKEILLVPIHWRQKNNV